MITTIVENIESLRVFNVLINKSQVPSLKDLPFIDVTLLGLSQKQWQFDRGRRTFRDYHLLNNDGTIGDPAVKFKYNYTLDSSDNKTVTSFTIDIEYFDNSGIIGLTKRLEKEITGEKLEEFNKMIRRNQVTWLQSQGKALRSKAENYPEPDKSEAIAFSNLIDSLWILWKDEIIEYESIGNLNLQNRVTTEQIPELDYIDPETGLSMRQILLYQIT